MKNKSAKNYGLHLMIDGYGANSKKLADVNLMYQTLNQLPALIGMRKVGFPHIIQFTEGEIAGLSGFTFIIESHISIHTYSKKGFLSMDIYSCKTFDHNRAVKRIKRTYAIKKIEKQLIMRGNLFLQIPNNKKGTLKTRKERNA